MGVARAQERSKAGRAQNTESGLAERDVYRIFTQERGIALSQKVIKYIQKVLTAESVEACADEARALHKEGLLTEEEVDAAVKNRVKEKQTVEVKKVEYKPEGIERYRILKERVAGRKTPIVALKPETPALIFGMARVGENGVIEIEDEDEKISVAKIEQKEYFLCRGVCAGFEGRISQSGLIVEKIHLPEIKKQKKHSLCNFIVISQFVASEENIAKVGEAVKVYEEYETEIAAVVIMLSPAENILNIQAKIKKTLLDEHKSVDFVIIPGVGKKYFYPHGECRAYKNLKIATNPAEITVDGLVFLAGAFSLIDGVKEESAVRGEFRKELGKVFLSQASYNPFITYTDLSHTESYAGVIIGDAYDSFVYKEEETAFYICGDFEKSKGQFLFYNGAERAFEVCSLGSAANA